MNAPANLPRILLIDSNVYFVEAAERRAEAAGLRSGSRARQAAYALTMLEWNAPAAIVCATNLREMGAYEMAPILRADPKTSSIPLIAVGDGGDQALLEAYRAGCDDYVDRRLPPGRHRRARAQFSRQPSGRFSAHADAFDRGNRA